MLLPQSLTKLIDQFESLPGIGPRTAERLVFYLLRTPVSFRHSFADSIKSLSTRIQLCSQCFNISEDKLCSICSDIKRQQEILCVVEEPLDLIAIENSGYKGLYHCLGGALSPLNNIGPEDLRISELIERVNMGNTQEVVLATNPSIEGEATAMYIRDKLRNGNKKLKVSRLGRGLPVGADVEFADSQTLARSLESRQEY